jgi:3-mercaptopyruvate sulfurtransferase SseA
VTVPASVERFGRPIPARPEFIIDIKEAKEFLADPNSELVSMRSWEEFIGNVSGHHYIGPKGRIPGAVSVIAAVTPITWRTTATTIIRCALTTIST